MNLVRMQALAALGTLILLGVAAVGPASAVTPAWLRWGDCPSGQAPYVRMFACDTNEGFHRITIGMTATPDLVNVKGVYLYLIVRNDSGPLPEWWRLDPAGCRAGALQASIGLDDPPYEDGLCFNVWQGGDTLETYAFYNSVSDYLLIEAFVKPVAPVTFQNGRSYALAEVRIPNDGTTGPSACGGCQTDIVVMLATAGFETLGGWVNLGTWQELAWQDYIIVAEPTGAAGAPADSLTRSPGPAPR